ncbi:NADH-quinone oxidoreductase subunit L [Akkermansiaceae bacterium]|nr:NADH-quinone oxidoreductase subunit L [Akkermansiaceae bacterium]MDB4408693.1 NADH-quinone oxidoreductase subunit L [Akkermansiaceae bacterium]MDB4541624.1 NADH-quinone oxidoreductase subunit L [Akkermansiaceae bacterium]
MENLAWLLLALPLLSAATIHLGLKRLQNLSALVATTIAGVILAIAIILIGSETKDLAFSWASVPGLNLEIGLKLDSFAKNMMLVVTGVGFLVHLFSLAYMKDDSAKARYFGALSLFMFSMTGIVLASNFIMMFIFWELVGLSSYLLIGHWYEKDSAADAAKKAFLTNRIGDFGFMIGILMLWGITGSLTFDGLSEFFSGAPEYSAFFVGAAVLCVFAGAMGKSAQAPLHVWLPDAMEGPTPVSALIHAATMVAAGVFMMARLYLSIGTETIEALWGVNTIAWIGGITSLLAALMATQQDDIKKILAYSTLSQLGYMVMAVGLLNPEAGMFHLFTHAWFKALLFLGSGAVIYACHHEQNIWKMGGLKSKMPITTITFFIGTLALCGFPLTAGFFSKEGILEAALHTNMALFVIAALVACLTTFYMFRLFFIAFLGKNRSENADHAKEVGILMLIPLIVLTVMAVISGWNPIGAKLSPLHRAFVLHLDSPAFYASIGSFVIGFFIAFKLYFNAESDPLADNKVAKVFRNKFYVDEFYAKLVGYAQDGVAAVIHFIDELVIGGLLVGGLSRAAGGVGRIFTQMQSGNLQGYAGLFALGVILVIYLTVFV